MGSIREDEDEVKIIAKSIIDFCKMVEAVGTTVACVIAIPITIWLGSLLLGWAERHPMAVIIISAGTTALVIKSFWDWDGR